MIIDEFKGDNDTLNAVLNQNDVKATIKNIENVNLTWTANSDIAIDAVNMTGNTFNLDATGLAFSGNATIKNVGINNVNAGSKVTGTLALQDVLDSTVNAGSAKVVQLAEGTITAVDQKTMAAVTVNGDIEITNTDVELLTVSATKAATVKLSNIEEKLTVTGSNNVTIEVDVAGKEVVNSLTAGQLVVKATDAGSLDVTKVQANQIQIADAATDVTVVNGQNLAVVTGGDLDSLVAKTGLTNVTTNLTAAVTVAALDITGISNLNLDASKDVSVDLTTNAANNVVVTGAGKLDLAVDGVAAVDATAATAKFTFAAVSDEAVGVKGSSSSANAIDLENVATANATYIGGNGVDEVTIAAAAGTLAISAGAGDDLITLKGAVTGKATIDGGAGTDTVKIENVNAVAKATTGESDVSFVGVEKFVAADQTVFNNVQLSGKAYTLSSSGSGDDNLVVIAYDKTGTATAATTDLSGLVFDNAVGKNFSTVDINGLTGAVNTIKATKLDDTITGGTKGDVIDISQGGSDEIVIVAGDSTWAVGADNVDKITGFSAVADVKQADQLTFDASSVASAFAGFDVRSAVKAGVGNEAVSATVANGVLTLSGIDSNKIDTLEEWLSVSKLAADQGGAVAGETLAFAFGGSTYVFNVATISGSGGTAVVGDFDVVQLVGVAGITAVGLAEGANTIFIG